MKKAFIFAIVLVFLICAYAYAMDDNNSMRADNPKALLDTADMRYDRTPINKLTRGLGNTFTCYFEFPASIFRTGTERGPFLAWVIGPVNGIFTTLLRFASGIYDTVTFLIPPYGKPLMTPEYAFDSLSDAYNAYATVDDAPLR